MHNIDRTLTEFESETDMFESEAFESPIGFEAFDHAERERPFDEVEEMDLATELLGVTNEAELDQFLGNLFKKVGSVARRVAGPLGGILKGVAKTALPFVGGALGSFIPIPGVGTAVGTALGTALSRAMEVELEGGSLEDREFEMARQFVRLAGTATKQAAQAQSSANPQAAAKAAVMAAVRQQAPGILQGLAGAPTMASASSGTSRSGRWVRRGRRIVLLGV